MGGDRAVPHRDAASRPDLYGGGLRNRPGQDQGSGIRAAMRGREAAPPAFRSKVALLLAAAAFLLSSCSSFFQGSAPQRDGVLAAPGLSAPAEIVRDRYGIPHISARNDHDLYFAQGFAHAQDRLFQMDLERRLGRGALGGLFGEAAPPSDRLFRHLGFSSRAHGLFDSWPEKTKGIVRAYCDGVNAGMASLRA